MDERKPVKPDEAGAEWEHGVANLDDDDAIVACWD